ncbi:putative UDP-glucosyltransferase YjiC [Symbiodinium microadriaticum]|uniref:Putative UDP-glucosyltransferase YjiC n=1 Tax=Symbiodinium microadriaticum TaxID=2951 RepID=A0A1Q9F2W7_SYMMI|nr:putative UDP-glucosyltransferase YjiC [Symbiodinium microadriaticum]CAE7669677.1 yjiC [Symbiodinium microadriaticum]CAE7930504.1 yjiC [Symbiodinium sp. KB8]
MAKAHTFAFVFPMASGHINPSLGVARCLVERGHSVHYMCRPQMQAAIDDTGAKFHSEIDVQPELYVGREPDMIGAIASLQNEYGLTSQGYVRGRMLLKEIMSEMMLPGTLRWLQEIGADVVVCDPLINLEASLAAQLAGLPCASILTIAGPGAGQPAWQNILDAAGLTVEQMLEQRRQFQPLRECLQRLNARGLPLGLGDTLKPLGLLPAISLSQLTIVTTCEFLADPYPADMREAYDGAGANFAFVGPLLDKPGAKRAAGLRFDASLHKDNEHTASSEQDPVELVRDARKAGRKVVLASLGTMVTGDNNELGWRARPVVDGEPRGLTGKELCQAAWAGVFDAFGSDSSAAPLILVALGPQPDALDEMTVPPNAFCAPALPQVDVLRAGVDVFLQHGGQNSFMEALSTSVPMVVCPGFGDQIENAAKAESLGVGLKVDRPMGPVDKAASQAAAYREAAASSLRKVLSEPSYKDRALECARKLEAAGGVPRATELLLKLTEDKAPKAEEGKGQFPEAVANHAASVAAAGA